MSNDALTWAFHRPFRDASAKAVLVALADHANEDWECHPSVARLALFTGLSDKSVRMAIGRLIEVGAITRNGGQGKIGTFRLIKEWLGTSVTATDGQTETSVTATEEHRSQLPKSADPPRSELPKHFGSNDRALRSGLPNTSVTATDKPSVTPKNPQGTLTQEARENARPEPATRGTRLPADWQADAACVAYAVERGLDPADTAESFRDHWLASSQPNAVKRDWNAAWRNWCRSPYNQSRRPGGDHRSANGTDFSRGGGGFVGAAQRYAKRRGLGI